MKKVLAAVLTLCLCVNISFAFDPYADEEIEKKSYKKLYYGIALTLLGGFLAYDGFSQEEVDVSKPNVEYATVLHSEWSQNEGGGFNYTLRSGWSPYEYSPEGVPSTSIGIEENVLYNNGNVDLRNVTIEVRYKHANDIVIVDEYPETHLYNGTATSDGYHIATYYTDNQNPSAGGKTECIGIDLKKGQTLTWEDVWEYTTIVTSPPDGNPRETDKTKPNPEGLNLGENALNLMDIRVVLNKDKQYKPIYEKRNKSDIEGVCGIMVGIVGIYFIIDHFLDMHKFNVYAKRHNLNLKIATAPSEYKLMIQKRI